MVQGSEKSPYIVESNCNLRPGLTYEPRVEDYSILPTTPPKTTTAYHASLHICEPEKTLSDKERNVTEDCYLGY